MPQLSDQHAVLDLLKNLRGLAPLKELFWSRLNYDHVNLPLTRRNWTETASQALADDPLLFASGGADNGFHAIYARLNSDRLWLGLERPVVSRLLQDHPYALIVFSNAAQDRWHFLNVKYDDQVDKRRLFRRITVGPEERLRTAAERIALLDLGDGQLGPLDIQARHDEAFDVEKVTSKFFAAYREIFNQAEAKIMGIGNGVDYNARRLFTQRLFNRLLFIIFLERKGWLAFNGRHDYVQALWDAHQKEKAQGEAGNFYDERLKLLFFAALNTPNEVDVVGIQRNGVLQSRIGQAPYLNGGLFEEDDLDRQASVTVPDAALAPAIADLLYHFNFTVTESTPLDVEVAVDPEMLGKIFEELVTGRHETALLLVGSGGNYEIKLATTTNTVVVNDLTRGKAQTIATELSPLHDRVAFLQEEGGHRKVFVTDLSGDAKPMDKPLGAFYAQMEPCSWSPVTWSQDGKRFGFFACGKDNSVLVVVETEPELTPIVLKNTTAPQSPARQLFWLTNDSLLYTYQDSSTQRTLVSRVQVGEDNQPFAVYGK